MFARNGTALMGFLLKEVPVEAVVLVQALAPVKAVRVMVAHLMAKVLVVVVAPEVVMPIIQVDLDLEKVVQKARGLALEEDLRVAAVVEVGKAQVVAVVVAATNRAPALVAAVVRVRAQDPDLAALVVAVAVSARAVVAVVEAEVQMGVVETLAEVVKAMVLGLVAVVARKEVAEAVEVPEAVAVPALVQCVRSSASSQQSRKIVLAFSLMVLSLKAPLLGLELEKALVKVQAQAPVAAQAAAEVEVVEAAVVEAAEVAAAVVVVAQPAEVKDLAPVLDRVRVLDRVLETQVAAAVAVAVVAVANIKFAIPNTYTIAMTVKHFPSIGMRGKRFATELDNLTQRNCISLLVCSLSKV